MLENQLQEIVKEADLAQKVPKGRQTEREIRLEETKMKLAQTGAKLQTAQG